MRESRDQPPTTIGRAHARAALLGNPSDGYGGSTLAVTFAELGAQVTLGGGRTIADGDARRLVGAALARAGLGEGNAPAVGVTTTIPREVGLGGSSAIVIATLRAAAKHTGAEVAATELAALALAVERDDLGIAAGPQDRLAQAHGGLLYMDFADEEAGHCERLDPQLLPPLFVAWRLDAGQHSGTVHGDLRARFDAGDRRARSLLGEIAELARAGRRALIEGRRDELAALMLANVDARARLLDLDPRHLRMVELARAFGTGANYAGSGGAIVGVVPEGRDIAELRAAFAAEACELCAATPAT